MYNKIDIDRKKLTIMGVEFSDLKTLENTASAIGSNMFEGFIPTQQNVKIIRDYMIGKLSLNDLLIFIKDKTYV
ncbi:antitoxin VbhA family protein [Aequorivita marina]|uniref:antitoxin VbhA family protein n=1 Tax=Aequorivita marina TaxID=3073654 RepID=UPI002874CD21|nr:antitoxin VbhA family protein [Aequorivita sp. S2608]MDS1298625.1 antitoxin VbhA family protein [Aequorivita sp. S2608]